MPTSPITLTPVGGLPYAIVKGHLVMLYKGAWILDVEIDAEPLAQQGMPSGKCVVMFGGVPMAGTIDPASSGTFGPTAMARVVGGANGWSKSPPAAFYAADNGLLSTPIMSATAAAVGEVLTDLAPAVLGVSFTVSSAAPAMQVFGDDPWFVDTTGKTFHGPRLPSIPDPSLVIRDWDPIHARASFSCDTLLIPGTPLVDPRFNGSIFTVWNVEQVFDANGSTGWAWGTNTTTPVLPPLTPPTTIVDDLKAATLYWTRAGFLRVYRYRLVQYQGDGPGGPPARMALQAVTPAAGVPSLIPITPWSGVAGITATLAPSAEVEVVFENADPTLPRVISYSLQALPLTTAIDAVTELDVGPTAAQVKLAGGGKGVARVGDSIDISKLVVTAPSGGGPCTITGALAIGTGSLKVTSG